MTTAITSAAITERLPFWRKAALLWFAGVAGAFLLMPYVMSLPSFAAAQARTGFTAWQLVLISCTQTSVLMGAAVALGLWASRKAGFGTPLLDAWLGHTPLPAGLKRSLLVAVASGCAAGVALLACEELIFKPAGVLALFADAHVTAPAPWQAAIASVYGGIDEEILVRLCLLSLFALGLRRLAGSSTVPVSNGVFWAANLIAALLFGLGHLPATAALVPLTPLIVIRALVLNGGCGIVFGMMYRRYGLEWAMLAHFSCDIVVHLLTAL